jgi:hypothetical protein
MALIVAGWAAFKSMGGHQTKQSVEQSTKIGANVMQKTVSNCLTTTLSQNCLNVSGSNNYVSGVHQSVSIGRDAKCSTFASQNNTFKNDLKSSITQALEDKEVAGLQWMDTSKDENTVAIKRDIEATFTQETVQACVDNHVVGNCINVTGTSNTVENITQEAVLNSFSDCILSEKQTSEMVNKITDTTNQHATYTSENPLAFIGDAMKAIATSIAAVAAVIVIVLICFVFLFFMMSRGGATGAAAASAFPGLPPIILQAQMPGAAGY